MQLTILKFRGGLFLSVNRIITYLATLHPPQITLLLYLQMFLDNFSSPRIFQLVEAFVKPGENFIRSKPSLGQLILLVTFSSISGTVPKKDQGTWFKSL